MALLLIAAGLVLLFAGGEALVAGATGLAKKFGVSPFLIGAVVVGFGTSAPELLTSIQAVLDDSPGVAAGNVVGSNIANILLILGIAALIRPVDVDAGALRRDGAFFAMAMLLMAAAMRFAPMNRMTGLLLVAALLAYIFMTWLLDRTGRGPAAELHVAEGESVAAPRRTAISAGLVVIGLAALVAGASFLVNGSISVASALGVPEAVIGLTIVAVGTSLPELAAAFSAARKGEGALVLGNVLGSNIFNGLGILGAAALTRPFDLPARFASTDLLIMLAAAALLLVFAVTGARIDRREGGIFLLLYAAFIAWLAWGALS